MRHQNESSLDLLVPFLLDAQDEIKDLIGRKYGQQSPGGTTKEGGVLRGDLAHFSRFLLRHSADPEVRAIIERRYWECGRILGIISGNQSQICDFFERLDEGSRSILRFLNDRRHATLEDMSKISSSTHYDVLYRLKEVIIPESIKQFGKPIVKFLEFNIDPLTGEKIPYSWWMNDDAVYKSESIGMTEEPDALIITLERVGLDLPEPIQAQATYKHGILEIQVNKGREMI